MVSTLTRRDFLKLYKDLQKTVKQFPQYNYKHFGRRRIRDYFEANRSVTDSVEREQLFKEGQEALTVIRRQALISVQYPHRPLIIECSISTLPLQEVFAKEQEQEFLLTNLDKIVKGTKGLPQKPLY